MKYSTEDYLTEMNKPLLAIKLLSVILDDYIFDDVVSILHNTQFEKDQNTSALLYTINLLQKEVYKHRDNCLDNLYKT